MKSTSLAASLALFVSVLPANADTTIYYPTQEKASFAIDCPKDWKLEPGENVGDYFEIEGPTGVTFSFRTLPSKTEKQGTEALRGAIDEAVAFLKEHYSDIKIEGPKDDKINGLEGFYLVGSGSNKESGQTEVFAMGWYALKDGTIGEIWLVADPEDKEGFAAAEKILKTFRVP